MAIADHTPLSWLRLSSALIGCLGDRPPQENIVHNNFVSGRHSYLECWVIWSPTTLTGDKTWTSKSAGRQQEGCDAEPRRSQDSVHKKALVAVPQTLTEITTI